MTALSDSYKNKTETHTHTHTHTHTVNTEGTDNYTQRLTARTEGTHTYTQIHPRSNKQQRHRLMDARGYKKEWRWGDTKKKKEREKGSVKAGESTRGERYIEF